MSPCKCQPQVKSHGNQGLVLGFGHVGVTETMEDQIWLMKPIGMGSRVIRW